MAIIELDINVEDVGNISLLYDRIQLFRSPDQSGTTIPFVAITDNDPTSAILDGSVEGPWGLSGKVLSISVDSADAVSVTFAGTDPLNLTTVLAKINTTFSHLGYPLALEVPSDTDKIRLRSGSNGTQSSLLVSGSAASVIGLSTLKVNGKGASPLLSPNTERYAIFDFDGLPTYWYKARYVNAETGAASDLSDAFLGGDGDGLPDSRLATGRIALSDVAGRPIVGRRIIFVPTGTQVVADGLGNNYGVLPSVDRIEIFTDSNGRAEIALVKGQRLKVFLEGSSFQREFVVPTSDFDILSVASVQPDPFSIVVVPPFPIRVS